MTNLVDKLASAVVFGVLSLLIAPLRLARRFERRPIPRNYEPDEETLRALGEEILAVIEEGK